MNTIKQKRGSKYLVDLGSLKLPGDVEKDVEARIQKVILRAISDLDLRGDDLNPFPPGLFGLLPPDYPDLPLYPIERKLRSILSEEELAAISLLDISTAAQEHTQIVRKVMEKPLHVIRKLPSKSSGPLRASQTDILHAAALATTDDERISNRLKLMAKLLPEVEGAKQRLPSPTREALDEITREISTGSAEEIVHKLREMQNSHKYDNYDGLSIGLELTIEAIKDGIDSIYSPDFPFYDLGRETPSQRRQVTNITGADAAGLVGGAAGGAILGLALPAPGAGPAAGAAAGALVCGVGASVGKAVEEVWNWLFD